MAHEQDLYLYVSNGNCPNKSSSKCFSHFLWLLNVPCCWQYQSGWRHWYLASTCTIEQDLGHGIPWTSQIRISLRWKEHKGTTLGTTLGTVGVEIDVGPSSRSCGHTAPCYLVCWLHPPAPGGMRLPFARGIPGRTAWPIAMRTALSGWCIGGVGLPMSQADQTAQRNTGISWHLVL